MTHWFTRNVSHKSAEQHGAKGLPQTQTFMRKRGWGIYPLEAYLEGVQCGEIVTFPFNRNTSGDLRLRWQWIRSSEHLNLYRPNPPPTTHSIHRKEGLFDHSRGEPIASSSVPLLHWNIEGWAIRMPRKCGSAKPEFPLKRFFPWLDS